MKRFCGVLMAMMLGVCMAQERTQPFLLQVNCTPSATLRINYQEVGSGRQFTKELPPKGTAILQLTAPGYKQYIRSISLYEGGRQYEEVKLIPEPVPVVIKSNVPARIFLDRRELGTTPLPTRFDKPDLYTITARADGYKEEMFELDLRNAKPQIKTVTLSSDSGALQITSQPAGATLEVNGSDRGVTPCTLERLQEGTLRLRLTKKGYKEVKREVTVTAGKSEPIHVQMEALPAALQVATLPEGARVYLNNEFRGTSNYKHESLKAGTYTIRVEKEGYATQQATVALEPGAAVSREFRLVQNFGTVVLRTRPPVAEVWVDGKKVAKTQPDETSTQYVSQRLEWSLLPGTHTLRLCADGYADVTKVVDVKAFQEIALNISMTFKPSVQLKTTTGVVTGNIVSEDKSTGTLRIETKPGIIRSFTKAEILERKALYE